MYFEELKKIDIDRYKKEIDKYMGLISKIDNIESNDELNYVLTYICEKLELELAWTGDFDSFMNSKENCLEFK